MKDAEEKSAKVRSLKCITGFGVEKPPCVHTDRQWCNKPMEPDGKKIGSKQLMQQSRKSLLIQFDVTMCNVLREADVGSRCDVRLWGWCRAQHAEQEPESLWIYQQHVLNWCLYCVCSLGIKR